MLASASTPATMAQLWRNSGGAIVSSVSATGVMMASKFIGDGSGLTGIAGTLPGGSSGDTLRYNGADWVANSVIYNNGTNVGIGTTAPAYKLDVTGQVNVSAQLAVGSLAAPNVSRTINAAEEYGANANRFGMYLTTNISTQTMTAARTSYGVYSLLDNYNDDASGYGQNLYAVYGYARNRAARTLNTVYGVYGIADNTNAGGVITSAYGLYSDVNRTAGAITTGYAAYLGDVAATNQYGLYQAGATDTNYFAGSVGIGTTDPGTNKLQVSGNADAVGFTESGSNTLTNDISGNAATATALAANGGNCAAGSFPLGVNASGAAETCSTSITGNAATASGLAAAPTICAAGNAPRGITAAGDATGCFAPSATAGITVYRYNWETCSGNGIAGGTTILTTLSSLSCTRCYPTLMNCTMRTSGGTCASGTQFMWCNGSCVDKGGSGPWTCAGVAVGHLMP